MIAGFLIADKGWRWFSILCGILAGANLFSILFFFPETNYRRVLNDNVTSEEADIQAMQMLEYRKTGKDSEAVPASSDIGLNRKYAGSYWKDLITFRDRGIETRGIWGWPRQFSLPFRFILVPHVLFAAISYGVFLAG